MSNNGDRNRSGTSTIHNSKLEMEHEGTHRRTANDALRAFIRLLDTNGHNMTQNFFSCNNCEIPLSFADCEELGISEEDGRSMKRLRAVVIDGTASGILTELPKFQREDVVVPGPKSMTNIYKSHKLLKKNPHRKALKKFFKNVKHSFRKWKNFKERPAPSNVLGQSLRIWMKKSDDTSLPGIQDMADALIRSERRILQLLLSENPCFCPPTESGVRISQAKESGHSCDCVRLRTVFDKANESQAVVDALRVVFHLTEGIATDSIQPYENDHSQEQGHERKTSQMNPEQGSCETDTTAGDGNNDDMGQIKVGEDAGDNATDLENEDEERESSESDDAYESDGNQRKQVFGVWATLALPGSAKRSQFIESTLILLEFLFTDSIFLPYVGTGCLPDLQTDESNRTSQRTMMEFTKTPLKLHAGIIDALQLYLSPCTENCLCEDRLSISTV